MRRPPSDPFRVSTTACCFSSSSHSSSSHYYRGLATGAFRRIPWKTERPCVRAHDDSCAHVTIDALTLGGLSSGLVWAYVWRRVRGKTAWRLLRRVAGLVFCAREITAGFTPVELVNLLWGLKEARLPDNRAGWVPDRTDVVDALIMSL